MLKIYKRLYSSTRPDKFPQAQKSLFYCLRSCYDEPSGFLILIFKPEIKQEDPNNPDVGVRLAQSS